MYPFTFQDDYNSESLKREFAEKVNSFKETLNRGLLGLPNLDTAKQAILDVLLTANEYNLGEKTTRGKILKLVNYMNKNCPNIPSNIDTINLRRTIYTASSINIYSYLYFITFTSCLLEINGNQILSGVSNPSFITITRIA